MNRKEEPPDKYRCLKLPITSILICDAERKQEVLNNMEILQNAIIRANSITTKTYFLLRLWVLQKYHTNLEIPEITEDTISMCMKSVLIPSSGQKPKGNNLLLLQEFKQLHNYQLEDGSNLSAILDYYTTTMITAVENNFLPNPRIGVKLRTIKMHVNAIMYTHNMRKYLKKLPQMKKHFTY